MRALFLSALAALLLAAACPPIPPNPVPGTGGTNPVPIDGGAGGAGGVAPVDGLVTLACANAQTKCGTNFQECVRQVTQLRSSPSYATLSDETLQRCAAAKDKPSLAACGMGLCQ